MIDMVLKNKTGVAYANDLTIFIIVYRVKGYQSDVDTSVWDIIYEISNSTVKFEAQVMK